MKKILLSTVIFLLTLSVFSKDFKEVTDETLTSETNSRIDNSALDVKVPKYIFSGLNTSIELVFKNPNNPKLIENNYELFFIINGQDTKINFNKSGVGTFSYSFKDSEKLSIYFENFSYSETMHIIPLWYILTPVSLLVVFLGYKLIRSGKKNKVILSEEITQDITAKNTFNSSSEGSNSTTKKEKIAIKEVMEKEEEVFS